MLAILNYLLPFQCFTLAARHTVPKGGGEINFFFQSFTSLLPYLPLGLTI